jgi:hypothetical protein
MFCALYSTEPLHIRCCNFFVFDFLVPAENVRHPWSFETFGVESVARRCSCLDLGSDFDRRF